MMNGLGNAQGWPACEFLLALSVSVKISVKDHKSSIILRWATETQECTASVIT